MNINIKKPNIKFKVKNASHLWNVFVRIGSNTVSQFFALFVVLLIINILSQQYFFRIDLTANDKFTLSQGTKNIITDIDETVTIKAFFSEDLPPNFVAITGRVKDLYEEYERYSNGNIEFEYKDPQDENFEKEATEAGIPELGYQDLTEDKYVRATGYLGVSIQYKDEKEVIEAVHEFNYENLEYETTSRIYKLTRDEKITIGFLTGHGEKDLFSELTSVNAQLERQFTTETVDISQGKPINPDEIAVLIIPAPTVAFTERDKFEIDQYIMRGGNVIFLAEQYQLDFQNPIVTKIENNTNSLISHYGTEVENSLLLDESNLPLESGIFQIDYPFSVLALSENMDQENPALTNVNSAVFHWVSPVIDKSNEEKTFTPLIQTTDNAWKREGDTISVMPEDIFPTEQQQYTLVGLIEGKQSSLFINKDIPQIEGEEVEDQRTAEDPRVNEVGDARIIVVGDSDFISDAPLGLYDGSVNFFLNIVEWLASSEDITSIRAKSIDTRPLDVTTSSQKNMIKTLNIIIIPLIVIGIGIMYNMWRNRRKSSI